VTGGAPLVERRHGKRTLRLGMEARAMTVGSCSEACFLKKPACPFASAFLLLAALHALVLLKRMLDLVLWKAHVGMAPRSTTGYRDIHAH
jgi:hypothetical protein